MKIYKKTPLLLYLGFGVIPLGFIAFKLISGEPFGYRDWQILVTGVVVIIAYFYEKSVPYITITENKIIKRDFFFLKWEIEFDKITSAIFKSGKYIFKSSDRALRIHNNQIPDETLSEMEALLEQKLKELSPLIDN